MGVVFAQARFNSIEAQHEQESSVLDPRESDARSDGHKHTTVNRANDSAVKRDIEHTTRSGNESKKSILALLKASDSVTILQQFKSGNIPKSLTTDPELQASVKTHVDYILSFSLKFFDESISNAHALLLAFNIPAETIHNIFQASFKDSLNNEWYNFRQSRELARYAALSEDEVVNIIEEAFVESIKITEDPLIDMFHGSLVYNLEQWFSECGLPEARRGSDRLKKIGITSLKAWISESPYAAYEIYKVLRLTLADLDTHVTRDAIVLGAQNLLSVGIEAIERFEEFCQAFELTTDEREEAICGALPRVILEGHPQTVREFVAKVRPSSGSLASKDVRQSAFNRALFFLVNDHHPLTIVLLECIPLEVEDTKSEKWVTSWIEVIKKSILEIKGVEGLSALEAKLSNSKKIISVSKLPSSTINPVLFEHIAGRLQDGEYANSCLIWSRLVEPGEKYFEGSLLEPLQRAFKEALSGPHGCFLADANKIEKTFELRTSDVAIWAKEAIFKAAKAGRFSALKNIIEAYSPCEDEVIELAKCSDFTDSISSAILRGESKEVRDWVSARYNVSTSTIYLGQVSGAEQILEQTHSDELISKLRVVALPAGIFEHERIANACACYFQRNLKWNWASEVIFKQVTDLFNEIQCSRTQQRSILTRMAVVIINRRLTCKVVGEFAKLAEFTPAEIKEVVKQGVSVLAQELSAQNNPELLKNYLAPLLALGGITNLREFPAPLGDIVRQLRIADCDGLNELFRTEPNWVKHFFELWEMRTALSSLDRIAAKRLHITLEDCEFLKRAKIDLVKLVRERNFDGLFDSLVEHSPRWQDDVNIVQPFRQGAAVFGAEKIMRLAGRNPAPKLHQFDKVLELYRESGLKPNVFYEQIINQVRLDTTEVDGSPSFDRLCTIAKTFPKDPDSLSVAAQRYLVVEPIRVLYQRYFDKDNRLDRKRVFSSWYDLQQFKRFAQLMERGVNLEKLSALEADPKRAGLYAWTAKLICHEGGTVNMDRVVSWALEPAKFWQNSDPHVPAEILGDIKPSALFDIQMLKGDFVAEDLQHAVVNGILDRIQLNDPLEITYQIPASGLIYSSVPEALRAALGSTKTDAPVLPRARNRTDLFIAVRRVLEKIESEEKISIDDFLSEKVTIPPPFEEEILELIYDSKIGIPEQWNTCVAAMHLKSDVDAVLAGNDTACCMSWGSAKFARYLVTPVVGHFTCQMQKGDGGSLRTIAQSIVTEDAVLGFEVGKEGLVVKDVLGAIKRSAQQDPEKLLKRTLAIDNIEPAPRCRTDKRLCETVEKVYNDFFTEYLELFGKMRGLTLDSIPVGKNFSIPLTAESAPNSSLPLMPIGYSDKTAAQVYLLKPKTHKWAVLRKVKTPQRAKVDWGNCDQRGVRLMRPMDMFDVVRKEINIYSENSVLLQGPLKLGNEYLASVINNEVKSRPHLSLVAEVGGVVQGYLLAYEGRASAADSENKEPAIYISDWACEPSHRTRAVHLVKRFLEIYKANYVDKGNAIPVVADMRDKTSFRMFPRLLNLAVAKLGIDVDVECVQGNGFFNEQLHRVIIRPKDKGELLSNAVISDSAQPSS